MCESKRRFSCLIMTGLVAAAMVGCGPVEQAGDKSLEEPELGKTIASLGDLYQAGAIEVRGFGIVAGLAGTGSSECDPVLRKVLVKFIQQQTNDASVVSANRFINSKDTAVVEVYGIIPPIALAGESFDLRVAALPNTQTTSLAGGRLFLTDLKEMARMQRYDQYAKTLATARGPIFIDKSVKPVQNPLVGHVLGGGKIIKAPQVSLLLFEPNFIAAGAIRNQLNGRFGRKTATAVSAEEVKVNIPRRFRDSKGRFLELVRTSYIGGDEVLQQQRIDMLIGKLVNTENKLASELALETMGKPALAKLAPLLGSTEELVRFHAARCMLNIGDDRALGVLRRFVYAPGSPVRIEAIRAVGSAAKRNDAVAILGEALNSDDFEVQFATYEQLLRLNALSISETIIGANFLLDSVASKGAKKIFVSRAVAPRIILFGVPIKCRENIFVKLDGNSIIINAAKGSSTISVMRQHPRQPELIGPAQSTFDLKDLIGTICERPIQPKGTRSKPGLGGGYSDMVEILEYMCKNGQIDAEFMAGPRVEFLRR